LLDSAHPSSRLASDVCRRKNFLAGAKFFVENTESRFLGFLWRRVAWDNGEIIFLARGIERAARVG
jgi:hypothetical protein